MLKGSGMCNIIIDTIAKRRWHWTPPVWKDTRHTAHRHAPVRPNTQSEPVTRTNRESWCVTESAVAHNVATHSVDDGLSGTAKLRRSIGVVAPDLLRRQSINRRTNLKFICLARFACAAGRVVACRPRQQCVWYTSIRPPHGRRSVFGGRVTSRYANSLRLKSNSRLGSGKLLLRWGKSVAVADRK